MPTLRKSVIQADGMALSAYRLGEGSQLAILLHGFPDDPSSLLLLARTLSTRGFTCIVPFMRGYGESGPAPDGDYHLTRLGRDALALMDSMGHRQAVIIGHDWGAAAGYTAALLAPERVTKLVTLAVPPPRTLLRRGLPNVRQLWRSRYMAQLQVPRVAEAMVRRNDFAYIDTLWKRWSPNWDAPRQLVRRVKDSLAPEENLRAALSYYRQLVRPRPHAPTLPETLRLMNRPLSTNTLVLAGENDGCMGTALFGGLEESFSSTWRAVVVPDSGHFLHLEAREAVADLICGFVAPPMGP